MQKGKRFRKDTSPNSTNIDTKEVSLHEYGPKAYEEVLSGIYTIHIAVWANFFAEIVLEDTETGKIFRYSGLNTENRKSEARQEFVKFYVGPCHVDVTRKHGKVRVVVRNTDTNDVVVDTTVGTSRHSFWGTEDPTD
jgi:hypothetical protein